jgi:hypothetical protein
MELNLNKLCIDTDRGRGPTSDNSKSGGLTHVYFRDLEQTVIDHIAKAKVVVGCVAWLTNELILKALARVPGGVSIVVQKEDFLRPDVGICGLKMLSGWKMRLSGLYNALGSRLRRFNFHGLVSALSVSGDPSIEAVRCVGNYNREKQPACPRMHNKFLVFCNTEKHEWNELKVLPYAVWTGSFNFTKNATMSLENALLLKDPIIVRAYFEEWQQILALSEPLNWEQDWVEPEWRVGT